jgi:predicted nuclease of predicted toxin-antitoxin system
MRILLDESVPARLGTLLVGHDAIPVQKRGWAGIRNGRLLALASEDFDVVLTADRGMEHQQNLATLPIAVLILVAKSNRIEDMGPLVAPTLEALANLVPRRLIVIDG